MAYDNLISRSDAAAQIPEQVSNEMLVNLQNESAVLALGQQIPISRSQVRFPVISALPTAYFVTGDTGLKQTTEMAWANKYLNVEELAAIVPVPEAVLDDAGFDVFGAIQPLIEQAIGRTLDAAVFFGTNKPSSWDFSVTDTPDATLGIVGAATASSPGPDNGVTRNTTATTGGVFKSISDVLGKLEADGYSATGAIANTTVKGLLRNARDANGVKLQETTDDLGELRYPMRGQWPTGSGAAELIAGDWTQLVVGVRQDFTIKRLDQAVIQNGNGDIVFNLAQQDMVALRVVFRVGVAVANPINYDEGDTPDRYPFAVLKTP